MKSSKRKKLTFGETEFFVICFETQLVGMKVKTSPVTIVAVVLLVCHSVYTLWVMRLAIERPLGSAPGTSLHASSFFFLLASPANAREVLAVSADGERTRRDDKVERAKA